MKINKKIIAFIAALAVTAVSVLIPWTDTADKTYAAEEVTVNVSSNINIEGRQISMDYQGSNESTVTMHKGSSIKLHINMTFNNLTANNPYVYCSNYSSRIPLDPYDREADLIIGPIDSEGDYIIESDFSTANANGGPLFTLHVRFIPEDGSTDPAGSSDDTTYDDWLWYVENVLNKPAEPEPELPNEFETAVNDSNAQLENALNRVQALLAAGDTAGVKDLMSKGITIDTGRLSCFRVNTYELIYKVTQAGIPVTLNFIYENKPYAITIPAYTKINPATLCDDKGFSGFLNLALKYGIRGR